MHGRFHLSYSSPRPAWLYPKILVLTQIVRAWSRPNEASPVWPPAGAVVAGAAARRTTGVLVRAFKAGWLPSATEGVVRYV